MNEMLATNQPHTTSIVHYNSAGFQMEPPPIDYDYYSQATTTGGSSTGYCDPNQYYCDDYLTYQSTEPQQQQQQQYLGSDFHPLEQPLNDQFLIKTEPDPDSKEKMSTINDLVRLIDLSSGEDKYQLQGKVKQLLLDHIQAKSPTGSSLITPPLSPDSEFLGYSPVATSTTPMVISKLPTTDPYKLDTPVVADNSILHETIPIVEEKKFDYQLETSVYSIQPKSQKIRGRKAKQTKERFVEKCSDSKLIEVGGEMPRKQSQKRSAHLSAEFRYRTKLNDKINKLRSLVSKQKNNLSKSAVLTRSIETIVRLQKLAIHLNEVNQQLQAKLKATTTTTASPPATPSVDKSWTYSFATKMEMKAPNIDQPNSNRSPPPPANTSPFCPTDTLSPYPTFC